MSHRCIFCVALFVFVGCASSGHSYIYDPAERGADVQSSLLYEQTPILLRHVSSDSSFTPKERIELANQLRSLTHILFVLHNKSYSQLQSALHIQRLDTPDVAVRVTSYGKPIANIQDDGLITIDSHILLAAFRTAISTAATETHRVRAISKEDELTTFVQAQRRMVFAMRPVMHHVGGGRSGGSVEWAVPTTLRVDSTTFKYWRSVSNHYAGMLLFILAHEMGHRALHHRNSGSSRQTCLLFQNQEYDADQYAVVLLGMNLRDLGVRGGSSLPISDPYVGYVDFFSITYDLAGFRGEEHGRECSYPSAELRRQVARSAFEALKDR